VKPIGEMLDQERDMELARLRQENEALRKANERLEARLEALHEARHAIASAAYQTGQAGV